MDADIRALKNQVDGLTRGVNRLCNVLEALNINFVEFYKMIKELEEVARMNLAGEKRTNGTGN